MLQSLSINILVGNYENEVNNLEKDYTLIQDASEANNQIISKKPILVSASIGK